MYSETSGAPAAFCWYEGTNREHCSHHPYHPVSRLFVRRRGYGLMLVASCPPPRLWRRFSFAWVAQPEGGACLRSRAVWVRIPPHAPGALFPRAACKAVAWSRVAGKWFDSTSAHPISSPKASSAWESPVAWATPLGLPSGVPWVIPSAAPWESPAASPCRWRCPWLHRRHASGSR